MILNSNKIRRLFMSVALPMLTDTTYQCPSREWVAELFRQFDHDMEWKPRKAGLLQRIFGDALWCWTERNDCDNFALHFMSTAQKLHKFTEQHTAQNVAVGEVWYMKDMTDYHAINVVVIGEESVLFIEPQGPHFVELTEAERDSISEVRI